MNKAGETWVKNYYFQGLGLDPEYGDSFESLYDQQTYFREFLVPMSFMCSGLTPDKYDFVKAEKGDNEATDYIMNKVRKLNIPNNLIQFFNGQRIGFAWMYVLRPLCAYIHQSSTEAEVISNLRLSWEAFMKDKDIRYAAFDGYSTDVAIIVDKKTQQPVGEIPDNFILYPTNVRAGLGTSVLKNAVQKPYYLLSDVEYSLLNEASEKNIFNKHDSWETELPVVSDEGAVVIRKYQWFMEDKPPVKVAQMMGDMPKSMIDSCGDALHALIVMRNEGSKMDLEIVDYIQKEEAKLVDDIDRPMAPGYRIYSDPAQDLSKMGFTCKELSEVIEIFCKENDLSKDISVQQLIDWYNADDNEPAPAPVQTATKFSDEAFKSVCEELHVPEWAVTESAMDLFMVANTMEEAYRSLIKFLSENVGSMESAVDQASSIGIPLSVINDAATSASNVDDFWKRVVAESSGVVDNKKSLVEDASSHGFPKEIVDKVSSAEYNVSTKAAFWQAMAEECMKSKVSPLGSLRSVSRDMGIPMDIISTFEGGEDDEAVTADFWKKMCEGLYGQRNERKLVDLDTLVRTASDVSIPADIVNDVITNQPSMVEESAFWMVMSGALANAYNEKAEITEAPAVEPEYFDAMHEAGVTMLNEIRSYINVNPDIKERMKITDCIQIYFRIVMGVMTNKDDILESLIEIRDEGGPETKSILDKVIPILE